ncbi:hypothetical protein [Methylocella sp.]|jgi:uncharacterized protein GlcG (DUF336 family)|uniref:hypothetical protein n=1 Tax=Methylocella sp. TaxID=1978226 RepID=UPI003C1C659A
MYREILLTVAAACLCSTAVKAGNSPWCDSGVTNSSLAAALKSAVNTPGNGGLGLNSWATVVNNDGTVCAIAYTGANYTQQWLASRVISAQKAATANSLSLAVTTGSPKPGSLALSSGNLYSADRDGGSLFGLQFSNPVDPFDAYHNPDGSTPNQDLSATFGTANDPLLGRPIGGINVFGGGLALYNKSGHKVGGIGVSGDTSCTDHMNAWIARSILKLDYLKTGGIAGPASLFAGDTAHPDNIIFDIANNTSGLVGSNQLSPSGFGHPQCLNNPAFSSKTKTPTSLPAVE